MMEKIGTVIKTELTMILLPRSDDQAFFLFPLHLDKTP